MHAEESNFSVYANKSNHKTFTDLGEGWARTHEGWSGDVGVGHSTNVVFSCKNSQVNWEKKDVPREASYRTFNDVVHSK